MVSKIFIELELRAVTSVAVLFVSPQFHAECKRFFAQRAYLAGFLIVLSCMLF